MISVERNAVAGNKHTPYLRPEDKMGFAVPKARTHSLMLLNGYMRTDMLLHIHLRIREMKEAGEPGSLLSHLAKSLGQVIDTWGDRNLFECVARNQYHIDTDYEFQPEHDYLHDVRLMKHHLTCHCKTIDELGRLQLTASTVGF